MLKQCAGPLLALLLGLLTLPAHADDWTTAISGGSEIELPTFLAEGDGRLLQENGEAYGTEYQSIDRGIVLRQYRSKATGRPYGYLMLNLGVIASSISYSVDKDTLGVMSGRRGELIFYAACRGEPDEIVCMDIHYDAVRHYEHEAMIERIAQSFINGGS